MKIYQSAQSRSWRVWRCTTACFTFVALLAPLLLPLGFPLRGVLCSLSIVLGCACGYVMYASKYASEIRVDKDGLMIIDLLGMSEISHGDLLRVKQHRESLIVYSRRRLVPYVIHGFSRGEVMAIIADIGELGGRESD